MTVGHGKSQITNPKSQTNAKSQLTNSKRLEFGACSSWSLFEFWSLGFGALEPSSLILRDATSR
jgi:hypothetical protein